jgi:8-oxo-dGTP pyrophosphatase MutT (NUDIX family)
METEIINKISNCSVSYGVIAIYVTDGNTHIYNNIQKFLKSINEIKYKENIECVNDDAKKLFIEYKEKLKFLLISKKYSYGFTDIISGHYNLNSKSGINNLIKQLTPMEIEKIKNDDFDDMWNEFYKLKNINYDMSRKKFIYFRNNLIENKYNLTNKYNNPDWEFPKGKKNIEEEDDIQCAIREFKEETKLKNKDFKIYKNIEPLIEHFKGTDEKFYKYVYYIALLKKDTIIDIMKNRIEVSEIGLYDYDNAITKIRKYYKNRLQILYSVFTNIVNWIILHNVKNI